MNRTYSGFLRLAVICNIANLFLFVYTIENLCFNQVKMIVSKQSVPGTLESSQFVFEAIVFLQSLFVFQVFFLSWWEIHTLTQLFCFTSLERSHAFSHDLMNVYFQFGVNVNAV